MPVRKILYLSGLILLMSVSGCEDQVPEEITDIEVSRLFSPTGLDVRVVNKTSVRLNWQPVRKASGYTIEFFDNGQLDFSGTPLKIFLDVTPDQLPIVIRGFAGESDFSVRIKAIGEDIQHSKWIYATFSTEAEQILYKVKPENIEATQVILNWPKGEHATTIVLEPGNITHILTEDEIVAGEAIVTGLTGETDYTARILYQNIVRGTTGFTTLFDPANGIVVTPADDLKAMIEAANPGDIFVLMPGTYPVPIDQEIYINNTIRIVGARPTDRPILVGTTLRLRNGAGLWIKDVVFDGLVGATRALYPIRYQTNPPDSTFDDLILENSVVRNYFRSLLHAHLNMLVESVTIRGTIIDNIECNGGDFIDFRNGMTRRFEFYNNTISNSAWDRDILRMDHVGAFASRNVQSLINVSNNTFYRVVNINPATTRRILYVRHPNHQITANNNIFVETFANYSNQPVTNVVAMSHNNYFMAPNLHNSAFIVHDRGLFTTLNPGFVNPGTGDFTITNEQLIFNRIGDPRWLP